ncbi:nesprin-2-like [Megalops cyprinoides]|uniref:nesprin-2-like n=1 Tax=Megalops cyprinoides TaxID=118141 RepID=UPI0018644756|nr:nesprin-2-like [Megalops cyprinoides]
MALVTECHSWILPGSNEALLKGMAPRHRTPFLVEQEQIQKRTFTNWINAQLSKRTPPSVVLDLFSDLQDGTRLLDLLEVMSSQRMKREKGRGVFQHRSNIETALNFLKKKSIKLVNINVPDIIDGRPSIILGLVWSIILHCHIEELANTLSFSSRHSSLESLESLGSQDSPRSSPAQHRASPLHARFRISAKKALLLWVREQCSRAGCTLNIKDFKSSWRSGVVFLAILHSLRPDLVDLSEAENRTNQQNLEEAFRLAERELRIPRLLEPEDVDIKDPDEKSIMTYVAQFLQYSKDLSVPEEDSQVHSLTPPTCLSPVHLPSHFTPAVAASPVHQATPSQKVREVTLWLQQAHQELLEVWGSTEGRSYAQRYQAFQTFVVPFDEQRRHVMPMLSAARGHSSEEQRALRQAFDILAEEVQQCETQLDHSLPAPLDAVGRWLLQVERVLTEEDGHTRDHAHAAQKARDKRELLKASMKEMGVHLQTLQTFPNTDEYGDTLVPAGKLDQIKRRFTSARVTAKYHGIKLEFQECRHSVLDQLTQMDCKIRSWREHYSSQEAVRQRLQDWHETVEKQGLVSQLEAALLRMKAVASNYTSKSALVEDSQRVARLVREAESESTLRTDAVAAVRGALERALSAWDNYHQDLRALQAWLGQEATRTPGGTEVMSESLSQWSTRQAHLNEVGNLLIEGTDAETSRSLAAELQALNKQWATFITRTRFAVSPAPGGAPKKPHMVQALTQEATLLLREPLEVSSTSLCAYRKRLQLMVTKLKTTDLDSTSADFSGQILQKLRLSVHEVKQALDGAERASEQLQRNASVLEGRVAELEHWDTEAREVYWLLKEGERRGQWGHDPRAKVLISRGLQLEGQVVTEHQDFQAGLVTVRRSWPLLCLSGSEMQDRIRHALTQSKEAVGMLSSLGVRRHQSPGEAQPPAKIFIQMGEKPHSTDPQPQELNDPSIPDLALLRPFTYAQAVVQPQAKASLQPQAQTQTSPLTPIHSQAKIQPQAYGKVPAHTSAQPEPHTYTSHNTQHPYQPYICTQTQDQHTPQPHVQPQPQATSRSKDSPQSQAKVQPDIQASARPKNLPQSQAKVQPQVQASARPKDLPQSQAKVQPDVQASAGPKNLPQSQAKVQPDVQASARPKNLPQSQAKVQPQVQTSARPKDIPQSQAKVQPQVQTSARPKDIPQSQAKVQPQVQASAGPKDLPQSQAQVQPQACLHEKASAKPQDSARPQLLSQSQAQVQAPVLVPARIQILPHAQPLSPTHTYMQAKTPPLVRQTPQTSTETDSKAEVQAKDRFERARKCLQDCILGAIAVYSSRQTSEEGAARKEAILQTLNPAILEEFLRSSEGLGSFCSVAQLREVEALTCSVRTQWEVCLSMVDSMAQACQHMGALRDLCNLLNSEGTHRLSMVQLKECERRMQTVQRRFGEVRDTLPSQARHKRKGTTEELCQQDSPEGPVVSKVIVRADSVKVKQTAEHTVIQAFPTEEESAEQEELERYQASSSAFETQLEQNQKSLQSEFPPGSVTLSAVRAHLQELQRLKEGTEQLWFEFELQYSQCSQLEGVGHSMEEHRNKLLQQWRGQQIWLQRRMKSLHTTLELVGSVDDDMVRISECLDLLFEKPKEICALTLSEASVLQDNIKDMEEGIQRGMDCLSSVDREDREVPGELDPDERLALGRATLGCRRALDELRQRVFRAGAAVRALDRFLATLRGVERDVAGVWAPTPQGAVGAARDCRARLAGVRLCAREAGDEAVRLDRLLGEARLSLVKDAVPTSCQDLVLELVQRLEEADAHFAQRMQEGAGQEMPLLGERRKVLRTALQEVRGAAESQALKEPTLPALQHRMRALADMQARLTAQRTELESLQQAPETGRGSEDPTGELETLWEEAHRTVTERQEQCRTLTDLLKRFQTCRGHLGATLQRAEFTLSEHTSYMAKDNLQRLITKVRGIKEDLAGLSEGVDEIRGVCRQLQSQLRKVPGCPDAPFESEADDLVDRWLDVTEKTDSHMDSLQVGLALWEKLLQLGGEVEGWTGNKLSIFVEAHPFQSDQEVKDLQDEIWEQEKNLEHFHRRSSEIQVLLQSKEPPLDLQVMESQLRKRMEQVKELFSESRDLFQHLKAVRGHITTRMAECQSSLWDIQSSLSALSASQTSPLIPQIEALSAQLQSQVEQTDALMEEVRLLAGVASPQILEALAAEGLLLKEDVRTTQELIDHKRAQLERGALDVTECSQGHTKDGQRGLKAALEDGKLPHVLQPLGNLGGEQVVQVGRGCRDDRGDGGSPMSTLTGTSQVPLAGEKVDSTAMKAAAPPYEKQVGLPTQAGASSGISDQFHHAARLKSDDQQVNKKELAKTPKAQKKADHRKLHAKRVEPGAPLYDPQCSDIQRRETAVTENAGAGSEYITIIETDAKKTDSVSQIPKTKPHRAEGTRTTQTKTLTIDRTTTAVQDTVIPGNDSRTSVGRDAEIVKTTDQQPGTGPCKRIETTGKALSIIPDTDLTRRHHDRQTDTELSEPPDVRQTDAHHTKSKHCPKKVVSIILDTDQLTGVKSSDRPHHENPTAPHIKTEVPDKADHETNDSNMPGTEPCCTETLSKEEHDRRLMGTDMPHTGRGLWGKSEIHMKGQSIIPDTDIHSTGTEVWGTDTAKAEHFESSEVQHRGQGSHDPTEPSVRHTRDSGGQSIDVTEWKISSLADHCLSTETAQHEIETQTDLHLVTETTQLETENQADLCLGTETMEHDIETQDLHLSTETTQREKDSQADLRLSTEAAQCETETQADLRLSTEATQRKTEIQVEHHNSVETPQPAKKVVALVLDTNSLYIQTPETCHLTHSDIMRIVSTGIPGVAATPKGPHAVHVPPSGTVALAEAERIHSTCGQVAGTQSFGAARLRETREETPHTDPVLGPSKDPIPGVDPAGICPEQEEHVQTSLRQPGENLCIRAIGPRKQVKAEDYGSTSHLDSPSLAKRPGGRRMENLSSMESAEEVQVAPRGQNQPQDPACRHTTLENRTAVQYLEAEPNGYITRDVQPRGDKEFLDTPIRDLENKLTRMVLRIVGCRNQPTRLEPGAMAQQVEEAEDCKRCIQEQLSQLDAAEGGDSEALKRMERRWSAALVEASSTVAAKKTQIELVTQLDRQKQAASTSLDRLGTELQALTLGPTESSTVQAEKLLTLLQGMEREGAVMEELLQVCAQVSPCLGEADRAVALACISDLRDRWQVLQGSAERALRCASAHAKETAAISLEGREIRTRLESLHRSLGPLELSLSPDSAVQRAVISSELAATTRQYLRLQRLAEALTQSLLGEREKEYVRQALQGVKEELELVEVKLSAGPRGFESLMLGRIVQAIQDDLTWAKWVEGDLTGRKRVALLPQEAREQIAGLRRLQKEASGKRAAVEPLLRDLEVLASEPEREGISAAISAATALQDLTEWVTMATAKALQEAETGLRGREEVWAQIEEAEAWVAAYIEREASGDGDLDGSMPHPEHSLQHHLHALEDAEKRAAATHDLLVRARAVALELSTADSHRLGYTLASLQEEVEGIVSRERANCEGLQELAQERASAAETLVALQESLRQISMDLEGLGSPLSPASLSGAEPLRERILELRAQLEGLRHCEEDRRKALLKAACELQQRANTLERRAQEHRRYERLAQRTEDLSVAAGGRKAPLTQLSLLRVLCRDAAEQLRRIAPDLDPSRLAAEQCRVRQLEESIAGLEHAACRGAEVQEQAIPASLTYNTEHNAVVGLLQWAGAELERVGQVVPEERTLEEELWRCASLRSSVETRLGVLETLRHKEAPGERGLDRKHTALQEQGRAFLRQCNMHMESLSQAKAAVRDYHTATRDTIWFLQDAQSVLHPFPNQVGDCAANELHQALAAVEEGFQAHVTRLQMLVPQQDCLSASEVKQLHRRTLGKLLVEQAALQAQGQVQLEALHRCAEMRRILRKCLEGIGQCLKSTETSLSECIAHKTTSDEECLNQQEKLRVILKELDALQGALSGQLAEQRKWCLVQGCGRDVEGTLAALWRRWAQLRGLARHLRARSERRGAEWRDVAGAVKRAKTTLERLEAELPANCKEMTLEELQMFLGRVKQNQDCVEFESHALTALDLRLLRLLGVPPHQGQATPTQLCEELQAMQGHYRNLREKCILGQEAVRSEVREREQVQEDICAIRKKLAGTTSLLCGLEQLPSSRTLQEVRTELHSQNAMLQGIMDGVRRKYTEKRIQVPTEIEYPLQEVACSLKELERKVEEAGQKSSPLHRLSRSMTEVVEGLQEVQALLQQKSSSVTEAQTIQKRVWDRLEEWHSCMAVLEGEVQDMWAEHPEQAHVLMDRLMEPLQLYQQVAKQAEQRTAFLSRVPALLQEYEEMIDSSSRWLNEAQSWLDTPCSYSTAKCLSSHAQGLQTVLDDSEQMRRGLQAFIPVLQEITAACDTAALEEQLVRADQRIAGMQQGIVGPLAQLQYTAAEVVAMETEVKVMEKNMTKIRTILSSIDTASITPEEHLRNRQVILDNVQSMRRTIAEIQRCKSGLELPKGGSGTLSVFQRAQQLLQPIQDLEHLTKEQCISLKAAIELSMEQRRTSSSALMEAMMPRVPLSTLDELKQGPWEMALSHEKGEEKEGEEEEDRRSSHSSSSGTLTGSIAEDPDETCIGEGYAAGAGTGAPTFSLSTDEVFEPSPLPSAMELLKESRLLMPKDRTQIEGVMAGSPGTQDTCTFVSHTHLTDTVNIPSPKMYAGVVEKTPASGTISTQSQGTHPTLVSSEITCSKYTPPEATHRAVQKKKTAASVPLQPVLLSQKTVSACQETVPEPLKPVSAAPLQTVSAPQVTESQPLKPVPARQETVPKSLIPVAAPHVTVSEPRKAVSAAPLQTVSAPSAPALAPGETRPTQEGLHSCQEQAAHVADWLEKARKHLEDGALTMASRDDIEQQLQTCQNMLLQTERKVASLSAGGQQGTESLSSKLHLLKTNLLTFQLLLQGRWMEEEKRLHPGERPPAAGLTFSTTVPALTSDLIQQSHLQQREYECDLKEQRDLAQDVARLVSRRHLCRSPHETQTQPGSETEAHTAPTQPAGGTEAHTQMAAKLNSLEEAVHRTLPEAAAQLLVELWMPGCQGSVQVEGGISQQQAVIELEDVFGSAWSWVREFQVEPGENLDLQQGYKRLLQGLTGLVEEGRERLVRSQDLHLRSRADLQTLLSRHKKYFQDLGAHLAVVHHLSVRIPEAELWRQESSRAELEREVGALQQQAVEKGAWLQTALETWTRWEDSCERLGTLLQEAEARLPGVGPAEESGDHLQERIEVYQRTEVLLEENEGRLLQALDLGRRLCAGGRCGGVGVALRGLEARWLAVKKRVEQEQLHIEEIGNRWNRFQHDSEALSKWVANTWDRLQAWRALSITPAQEPAHLRTHLVQLLELAKEAESRLALKASVISSGEEFLRQRGREALDPRVQPEQLERSWAEILDTLPDVQRRLHQLLMEKLSLEEVMADLDSWLGGMESRLAEERERVHQASCTADLSQLLQHHQEFKQEVALHQLSLDFLNQSVGGTTGPADIWEKRDERTRFAEQLGALNLRWVSLQGALVSHGQRVEQLQLICTDRENKLQLLRSWVITETATVDEFQRPSSFSRAHADLTASQDTEETLKVKSAELQELRKSCQSGEQESDCAFVAQLDATWADFTALTQQITAVRPGQLRVVELWERFKEELGRAALETAKFRHTLEFTRTPQLSLSALQGHTHNLQVLQDRVREGEEVWETISRTLSSLGGVVSPIAALLLSDWLEEEKARWAELIQQVTEDLQKAQALLQLWQRYCSLTEGCFQGLQHHQEQWGALLSVPLPQDGSVEPLHTRVEAINVLQAGMEGLQVRMGAVLDTSKDLIRQMEPQAAVFIKSETQLLSQGLAQLGASLTGRQSQLQKDLDLLKDFHSHLESVEQHLRDFDSKLHGTPGPDQSQITKSDLLELTTLTSDLDALKETQHLIPRGSVTACRLEELGRRCTLASSRASERCSELQAEELQQQSLEQKCESWVAFLQSLEASLAEESITGCPSDLQEQLASHQRLQVEVSLGCHALHSLMCEALDVLERGEVEDRYDFVQKLARLIECWWGTMQEVQRRCALVQRLMGQWQLYAYGLRMLRGLLSGADPLLVPTGPAHCSLAQLRQHREDLKCIEIQLQRHLSSYLRTLEAGRQLRSAVGAEMQTQLADELGALKEVWERSQCMLEKRKVLMDTALQNWVRCQARLADSRCGLEEVKARLKQPLPELLEELRVTEKLTKEIEGSLEEWVHGLEELAPMKTDLARYIIAADMALLQGLQQQLHSQWEELCEKAFLRKQEISDRFDAKTVFEEKRKELCNWLMGMEGKVAGSADLSTKDALDKLNEECMREMSCLRENKALLERLGERLVAAGGECEEALRDVRDRWQHLSDHIESRVKQLRERLLKEQQLDQHVRGLWAWLSHTEAELTMPLLYSTCHSDEVQRMLAKQEDLERDLEQHSESIRSALSLCDTLLTEVDPCSDVDSTALQETSCSLSLRWRNICSLSLERRSRIEETGQLWREFLDEHSHFEDWLRAAEQTTADPNSANVLYTSAKEEAKKFEVLQREVHERIAHLEVLNKLYRRLARENRIDMAGKLRDKVHEANRRWDSLHRHIAAILRRLKHFTTQWEEFEGLREGLMFWLTELDLRLTNMEHLSESEAHDKLRQLTVMQQEIDLNGNNIDQLSVSGERLIQKSASADAVLIEEQLNELHSYSQEVFGRVDRFHYRLTHPRVVSEGEQDVEENTERSLEKEEEEGKDAERDDMVQQGLCHLATPQEHLASRALASEEPIPLEKDHTKDVSASSSREGEEEKASFYRPPSETSITEPPSQPSQEPQEKRYLYQDVIQRLGSSLTHTSTPCKQGYAKLMLECSGSIDRVKRVSLILDDVGDESPAEQGLTSLTTADKPSGVIHRWEVLQALSTEPRAHDQPHCPTSDLNNITAWLGRVLPELQQLEGPHPPTSIQDMESSVRSLKEMQRTFDRYKALMISLNLSGQEPWQGEGEPGMAGESELGVMGESEPGMAVAAGVRSMNLAWVEACTHLERWEETLRSALMMCQEFHETLHSTLLWLAQAEGRLFSVNIHHDPSLDPDTLRSHRDTLTGLERDLRERQEQMNALEEISSQLLLEACPEAGQVGKEGKEGAEAKEKLHVISNKLRLLLREVTRNLHAIRERLGTGSNSASETEGDRTIQEQEGETVVREPPTENRSVARRDPSPPRSFFYRVLRAAFPLHLLLLLLLVLACLVPPSEEDYSCSLSNNFARSLYPMLHYTNGPPPT